MPNIKSAEKRVQVAERNKERNVAIRSSVRTSIRKVFEAIRTADMDKVKEALNAAYKTIDKAVTKGVLHKNTAARNKSRISKHVNKMETSAK